MNGKRLVVVGGVAGGDSAAARARRLCEKCEIVVFERGLHVYFANCGLLYSVGGEIVVYCQSGQRSYFTCRILAQNGFRVRNLTGSYRTWAIAQAAPAS